MRKKALEIILACLFFLLLAVIDTYPLVRYLDKGMPYFPYPDRGYEVSYMVHGDYLQLYYNLWLFKDALSGNIPFFTNPYEFSVGKGYMPSFNPQFFPMSLFFAILSIFGDITAYNLLVISSYILSGLSSYLLIKLYTRSWVAGIIGGTIFSLFPYRTGELLGGHPNGFLFFLIPLTIYLLEKSFRDGSILASSGAGLCIISMALLEGHFHYYTFLFLFFFLPWRLFFDIYGNSEEIRLLKILRRKETIIIFSVGILTGFSLVMIKSNPPIYKDPVFYSSIIFPFILIGFWIIYSRFFSIATKMSFDQALKDDAPTYLPLSLFLIYLIRLIYPIEHLGKGIAIVAFFGVIALKGYRVSRVRGLIRGRILEATPFLKKRLFKTIVPFLFMCLLTIAWAFYTRSHLETSIAAEGRPITQIMKYSPELGDLLKRHNRSIEKNIYLGLVPFFLAMMGLFLKRIEGRRDIIFFGSVFIISLILSFGPNLEPYIHLYNILYNHLPFFNYPRVAGRMITITVIMMAILSGYSLKWLMSHPKNHDLSAIFHRVLIASIFIVVILDFISLKPRGISIPSKGNSVYEGIKKDLGDKKVLEIPIWPGDSAWSSIYQYYVTLYRYHMINGYDPGVSRRYVEQIFERLYPINFGELREEEYRTLKELEVKYIVMHEEEFPRKVSPFPFRSSLDNMKRSPYVKFLKKDGLIYLFVLNDNIKFIEKPSFTINSSIGGLYQAEALPRLVGSIAKDSEASGGEAAFGKRGSGEGWLLYGPYRTYPSGEYKALFRLKIGDEPAKGEGTQEVAFIDISTRISKDVLNRRVITRKDFTRTGYHDFILPFSLASPQILEFRVYYLNRLDLWVDYTYILPSGEKDPRWSYKSEDLFHLPDRIEGPTRRYPAGEYIATFYLKTDDNKTFENVADIQVLTEKGIVVQKSLKNKDFYVTGEYLPFSLSFRLDRQAFIDFKISSKDMTKISLDRIDIKKKDS